MPILVCRIIIMHLCTSMHINSTLLCCLYNYVRFLNVNYIRTLWDRKVAFSELQLEHNTEHCSLYQSGSVTGTSTWQWDALCGTYTSPESISHACLLCLHRKHLAKVGWGSYNSHMCHTLLTPLYKHSVPVHVSMFKTKMY